MNTARVSQTIGLGIPSMVIFGDVSKGRDAGRLTQCAGCKVPDLRAWQKKESRRDIKTGSRQCCSKCTSSRPRLASLMPWFEQIAIVPSECSVAVAERVEVFASELVCSWRPETRWARCQYSSHLTQGKQFVGSGPESGDTRSSGQGSKR